jgi:hypothetical protein
MMVFVICCLLNAVLLTGFRKDHSPALGYPDARTGGKCIPVTTASANCHPSSSLQQVADRVAFRLLVIGYSTSFQN